MSNLFEIENISKSFVYSTSAFSDDKKDFYALQSEEVVNDSFSGSLPAFVAAFSSRKKLTDDEINQLQDMINKMRG